MVVQGERLVIWDFKSINPYVVVKLLLFLYMCILKILNCGELNEYIHLITLRFLTLPKWTLSLILWALLLLQPIVYLLSFHTTTEIIFCDSRNHHKKLKNHHKNNLWWFKIVTWLIHKRRHRKYFVTVYSATVTKKFGDFAWDRMFKLWGFLW